MRKCTQEGRRRTPPIGTRPSTARKAKYPSSGEVAPIREAPGGQPRVIVPDPSQVLSGVAGALCGSTATAVVTVVRSRLRVRVRVRAAPGLVTEGITIEIANRHPEHMLRVADIDVGTRLGWFGRRTYTSVLAYTSPLMRGRVINPRGREPCFITRQDLNSEFGEGRLKHRIRARVHIGTRKKYSRRREVVDRNGAWKAS